jgi:hypothetical protein
MMMMIMMMIMMQTCGRPSCRYEWESRVEYPKTCPRCKGWRVNGLAPKTEYGQGVVEKMVLAGALKKGFEVVAPPTPTPAPAVDRFKQPEKCGGCRRTQSLMKYNEGMAEWLCVRCYNDSMRGEG